MGIAQLLGILWARKWVALVALAVTVVTALSIGLLLPPHYEATATMIVDVSEPDPVTGEHVGSPLVRSHQRTQTELVRSDRVALDVVNRLRLTAAPDYQAAYAERGKDKQGDIAAWIASRIKEDVDARFAEGSNIMAITFRAPTARSAALMANTYMEAYLDATLDMKVAPARRNAEWFEVQLQGLRKDLADAQAKLAAYRQENGIIGNLEQVDTETARLQSMSDQVIQVKGELIAAESLQRQLESGKGSAADALVEDANLQKLRSDLATVQASIAQARGTMGANHPAVVALNAQKATLEGQIATQVRNARASIASRVQALRGRAEALQAAYDAQERDLLAHQKQRDMLATLQKEVEVKQTQLAAAVSRASSLNLQGKIAFVNAVPLDEARAPDNKAFPNVPLIGALAVVLGGILGMALAILREIFDRRVRTLEDLEFATGAKAIASLVPARRRARGGPAVPDDLILQPHFRDTGLRLVKG